MSTLMDRCRREAEERYPCAIPGIIDDYERRRWVKLWAECLYAERSKRPPTVEVPPMISVDEAIEVIRGHLFRDQHPAESADTYLDEMYADLNRCLTAAATNNTNDNGN